MLGRVTHELMADYWPIADQDPDLSAPMLEFAGIWREMPKFVTNPHPGRLEHHGDSRRRA